MENPKTLVVCLWVTTVTDQAWELSYLSFKGNINNFIQATEENLRLV